MRIQTYKLCKRCLYLWVAILFALLFTFLIRLNHGTNTRSQRKQLMFPKKVAIKTIESNSFKKVYFHGENIHAGYLDHIMNVFHRCGYRKVSLPSDDWQVMWSHIYPFGIDALQMAISNMKRHQKINHFPGSGYITNKISIATLDLPAIPKAFRLPTEKSKFLNYMKEHEDKIWIQKSNHHRGISIKEAKDLVLDKEGSFIQEYISNPLLIDNRRFDLGIYVTLTSVEPLRVYIHDHTWLIRFCAHEYLPFDPNDKQKYVITDDYLPIWKMASFDKDYNDNKMTVKQALFSYLRSKNLDPLNLEEKIISTIVKIYEIKEKAFHTENLRLTKHSNFFEMVRFDFIVDEEMRVYLLEVNMSPNLSSGHFKENRLMYEQLVYSLFSLVGVATDRRTDIAYANADEQDMIVSDRDISVASKHCHTCSCTTGNQDCKVCFRCLSSEDKSTLKTAYREHISRKQWRNIYPNTNDYIPQDEASAVNKLQMNWYKHMFNKH